MNKLFLFGLLLLLAACTSGLLRWNQIPRVDGEGSSEAPNGLSVTPASGIQRGGIALTVRGTNFTEGDTVSIGGRTCSNVVVHSSEGITCVSPSLPPLSSSDIVVTSLTGKTTTLAAGFTTFSYVYLTEISTNKINVYRLNANGTLDFIEQLGADAAPEDIVAHASLPFVFVLSRPAGIVTTLSIELGTGRASVVGTQQFSSEIRSLITHPTGPYLYVVGRGTSAGMTRFFINESTGTLTAGGFLAAGLNPDGSVIDPTGRVAYVVNDDSPPTVSKFTVGAEGVLTAQSAHDIQNGASGATSPNRAVIDRASRFLYVNFTSGNVASLAIDLLTAELTHATGSPMEPAGGAAQTAVAVTSNGNFVLVAQNTLAQFLTLASNNGALSSGSSTPSTQGPKSTLVDPSGHFLLSAENGVNGNMASYRIEANGTVTAVDNEFVLGEATKVTVF